MSGRRPFSELTGDWSPTRRNRVDELIQELVKLVIGHFGDASGAEERTGTGRL